MKSLKFNLQDKQMEATIKPSNENGIPVKITLDFDPAEFHEAAKIAVQTYQSCANAYYRWQDLPLIHKENIILILDKNLLQDATFSRTSSDQVDNYREFARLKILIDSIDELAAENKIKSARKSKNLLSDQLLRLDLKMTTNHFHSVMDRLLDFSIKMNLDKDQHRKSKTDALKAFTSEVLLHRSLPVVNLTKNKNVQQDQESPSSENSEEEDQRSPAEKLREDKPKNLAEKYARLQSGKAECKIDVNNSIESVEMEEEGTTVSSSDISLGEVISSHKFKVPPQNTFVMNMMVRENSLKLENNNNYQSKSIKSITRKSQDPVTETEVIVRNDQKKQRARSYSRKSGTDENIKSKSRQHSSKPRAISRDGPQHRERNMKDLQTKEVFESQPTRPSKRSQSSKDKQTRKETSDKRKTSPTRYKNRRNQKDANQNAEVNFSRQQQTSYHSLEHALTVTTKGQTDKLKSPRDTNQNLEDKPKYKGGQQADSTSWVSCTSESSHDANSPLPCQFYHGHKHWNVEEQKHKANLSEVRHKGSRSMYLIFIGALLATGVFTAIVVVLSVLAIRYGYF